MNNNRKFLTSGILGFAAAALMAAPAFAIDQDIVILHTNDIHCGINDNVGYSGLTAYEKEMEKETPYVTLVDAGDAIQGAPVGTLSEGGYVIQIMNEAGFDVAVPGNHEFDYGMERFLGLSHQLDCGYVSCNFVNLPTKTTVFKPYKLLTYDDVTVAYVGVTTPESVTKSTPAYFQDIQGRYDYGFCQDSDGSALYAQVQKSVDAARADGADYVILVGHLGKDYVTERWSIGAVLANTNGVQAAIDGHSHQAYTELMPNKDGKMIPVAQTGTKLQNIGKMTISPDGTITTELLSAADLDGAKDAGMESFIDGIEAQYEESLKVVLGRTSVELTDSDPETGLRAVRNAETNLGDFCTDAMRYVTGADIAIMNGGGIRAGLAAGDITYGDALTVYPYGNMISVKRVSGQTLRDALELSASTCPEENGAFMHVSGMTYTIDTSVPSSVQTDDLGNFVCVAGEYRVKDICVNGEPLDLNAYYTVASHDYWLKNGGSGMTMFADCELVLDAAYVDVDTITGYIENYLDGEVGEEYADPAGQGRITIR